MTRQKKLLTTLLILIFLFIIFFIFYIKPVNYKTNIKVNTYNINSKTPKQNIKIVTFSDLNIGFDYQVADLTNLVAKINEVKPDIVVFNGDLFYQDASEQDISEVTKQLKKIKAIYGKFANLGEKDDKKVSNLLTNAEFEVIQNKNRVIYRDDNKINLVFIENNNYDKILSKLKDDEFNFVVLHNPSLIDKLLNYKIDVILAGHTLGGEYNIPIYGSLYPDLKENENYRGSWKDGDTLIVISNGIGNKHNKFRLLAPSSIEEFNIN